MGYSFQEPRLPSTMHAMVVTGHGGLDKLDYRAVPVPEPKPDEALIRVHACALNNTDIWTREDAYGPGYNPIAASDGRSGRDRRFPYIPGGDVAGEIVAVGQHVSREHIGRKVVLFPFRSSASPGYEHMADDVGLLGAKYDGGYADYVTWPISLCWTMPLDNSVASAAFPISGLTAWHMVEKSQIAAGERVLVTGATGGVGSFAVQIASKVFGAFVIALARDHSYDEMLFEMGASAVVPYRSEILADDILAAAGNQVDAVLDVVGKPLFETCLRVLRVGGRFATSGASGGPMAELDFRTLYLKHLTLLGCTLGTIREYHGLVSNIADGAVQPVIDRTFSLSQAREAQEYFKKGTKVGKVVLVSSAS